MNNHIDYGDYEYAGFQAKPSLSTMPSTTQESDSYGPFQASQYPQPPHRFDSKSDGNFYPAVAPQLGPMELSPGTPAAMSRAGSEFNSPVIYQGQLFSAATTPKPKGYNDSWEPSFPGPPGPPIRHLHSPFPATATMHQQTSAMSSGGFPSVAHSPAWINAGPEIEWNTVTRDSAYFFTEHERLRVIKMIEEKEQHVSRLREDASRLIAQESEIRDDLEHGEQTIRQLLTEFRTRGWLSETTGNMDDRL